MDFWTVYMAALTAIATWACLKLIVWFISEYWI